jgi:hypothetical protein
MSRDFTLREKLAAALAIIADIPFNDRKQMHADQVISLFQFDHDPVPYTHDGPPLHWNCVPRYIGEHREKTKSDVKMIYKVRRVAAAEEDFRRAILAKGEEATEEKHPRARQRIKSRGFQGHRRFNGEAVWKNDKR